MLKAYKFRIYPTEEQKQFFNQCIGNARFIYNHCLAIRNNDYKQNKKYTSRTKLSNHITDLKRNPLFKWLNLSDSIALQQSLIDLETAFQKFFKKETGYPRFHSKHRKNSYRTINQGKTIRIEKGKLRLPKLKSLVKIKLSRQIPKNGKIKNATVSKTPSNKYFVSLLVDENTSLGVSQANEVGIVLGIKTYITLSNGTKCHFDFFDSNVLKKLKKMDKRIRKLHHLFSRTMKKSQNHEKRRIKLARGYEKVCNIKYDFMQKLSRKLVNENQVIAIENLKIKNMIRNHNLAKSIQDNSWGKFVTMLEYKAKWQYNCQIVKVSTFYPSSQLCSVCGYKNPEVKDLKIRKWECPECHAKHDRDVNASINILNEGKRLLSVA